MSWGFRPARRSSTKPLIGLYAESGRGKTYSALLLSRGFVGPEGRIGMIETEAGRGEAFAELIEGGYDVLPLQGDFSPRRFGDAIAEAEKAQLDALIIDSASHEWNGVGGVLHMAATNEEEGKRGQLIWQKPKIDHERHFVLRLMQTSIPLVVVCMRAKFPLVKVKKKNGKEDMVRAELPSPKQSDDILYEMFVHGWIDEDHRFRATKYTLAELSSIIVDGERISLDTGRNLAAWASGERARGPESAGEDLLERAKLAASAGLDGYKSFVDALSRSERAALKPHHAVLKAKAASASSDSSDSGAEP